MLVEHVILSPVAAPSPGPALVLAAGCVPGRDGVPGSIVGHLLCGDWAIRAPHTVDHLVRGRWPLLVAVLAATVLAAVGWRLLRHRVWRTHAARARWLQIIPPVTATPAATVGLWRLLATVLPAPRRWALRPPRLVWEVQADPKGMRCGLWLPPGVNPTAVLRLLQRAWPGARAEQARPPAVSPDRPTAGVALVIGRPEWQPLLDGDRAWRASGRGQEDAPAEEDRLRAVYDGLASAGRTGGGLLQVHVCRAPRRRIAALRRATVHPERARRTNGGALRAVGLLAGGLRWLIIATLDLLTPGPSRPHGERRDPYAAELARQARAKYADAPHLLISVRATTTGPSMSAARTAADDITSGFGLLCAHGSRRRLRRPVRAAWFRWVPETQMILASVIEVAAFAGLPAEPAAYGLPAAASRRRPASREVFTTNLPYPANQASTTAPAWVAPAVRRRPTAAGPDPASGATPTAPPTTWSSR